MSTIRPFEKPLGMRDTLPKLYAQQHELRTTAMHYMTKNGYEFIQTPSLEYFETIGKISSLDEASLFKLVDNQGEMLVLRPDLTTPIARVAAAKLLTEKNPLRLAYSSTVFRSQQREGGRPAEFEQLGLELLGDTSAMADAEILRLAAGLLRELGLPNFTITVGHAGLINRAIDSLIDNQAAQHQVRAFLVEKNFVGIDRWAADYAASSEFYSFFQLANSGASLQELLSQFPSLKTEETEQFMSVVASLEQLPELRTCFQVDPLVVSHMHYYTGMVFEVYGEGSGFPLGNGGRYDELLQQFGPAVGATGFSIRMDHLLEILPARTETKTRHLIYMDDASYSKSLTLAEEFRAQGELVTLQWKASVKEPDLFEQNFDRITDTTKGAS
ncbi:ATP phosphoribosyltransferase regulatory subunit [Chryseomicrobium sp. FSL W7-1435]|uniref:ATP phosphoribosyltransferase regulatory subunit n=1 Tax=Chryseomicrobium sp. FSL W7-1435 TaxID=2921704 RepID=UPI00315AF689